MTWIFRCCKCSVGRGIVIRAKEISRWSENEWLCNLCMDLKFSRVLWKWKELYTIIIWIKVTYYNFCCRATICAVAPITFPINQKQITMKYFIPSPPPQKATSTVSIECKPYLSQHIYENEWSFMLGNSFLISEDIYLFAWKFNFPIHDFNIEHNIGALKLLSVIL